MPTLIVNADDFGRTAGINRGILEAHKKGIVTSTTVMANYPDAAEGVPKLLEEAPFLGVGLHLNLTSGKPVSAPDTVPTLVDAQGRFRPPQNWGAVMAAFAPDEVERELRAQFDRFVSLAGKLPTHLDSHHHAVYMCPAGLGTLLALTREHNLPVRRPRMGATAADAAEAWLLSGLAPAQAGAVLEELRGLLADYPELRMSDQFIDSFYGPRAILGELLAALTNLPQDGVAELMCHPGYAEGLDSVYAAPREDEIRWLTHPATHEVVTAEAIRLVSFAELRPA